MKMVRTLCVVALSASIAWIAVGAETTDKEKEKRTPAQVRMAVQEICPVSGEKLGSRGEPVAVKIGEEEVHLCCKGCASKQVSTEYWATIHANFAKAQGICPVMKHKLPKDAKWTIVEGQIIYVCCPPCIEKIEADPEAYVASVEELYRASLRQRESKE